MPTLKITHIKANGSASVTTTVETESENPLAVLEPILAKLRMEPLPPSAPEPKGQ